MPEGLEVAAAAAGLLMLMGDGRVDPVPEPGLRPLPATRECTQELGIQDPRIERQAPGRVIAAAPAFSGNEAGVSLARHA